MSDENVCNVDEAVLADVTNEGRLPFDYHLNGVAFLANWLASNRLAESPLFQEALALLRYFEQEPEEREQGRELDAANAVMLNGTVGAAVFQLRNRVSPQMRTEVERFATAPEAIVGNYYLFYIAGRLAGRGHAIDFVPESSEPRPDLRAERGGRHVFIEANARQPTVPVDTTERIWRMIETLIEQKKQKFTDPAFHPGMIVADISPAHFEVNEPGTPPFLELRRDLKEDLPGGGFISRLYEDETWRDRVYNQGNVFTYAVDEFLRIDTGRYGVTQFLLTAARRAVRRRDGKIAYPRYHVLICDQAHRANALLDLSRFVYLV